MTSVRRTVVQVDVTNYSQCSGWAAADKLLDHVVTGAAILARIRLAIINVEFTVLTLEALRTNALVIADLVLARAAILTRRRFAFVHLGRTIRSRVALMTVTSM